MSSLADLLVHLLIWSMPPLASSASLHSTQDYTREYLGRNLTWEMATYKNQCQNILISQDTQLTISSYLLLWKKLQVEIWQGTAIVSYKYKIKHISEDKRFIDLYLIIHINNLFSLQTCSERLFPLAKLCLRNRKCLRKKNKELSGRKLFTFQIQPFAYLVNSRGVVGKGLDDRRHKYFF